MVERLFRILKVTGSIPVISIDRILLGNVHNNTFYWLYIPWDYSTVFVLFLFACHFFLRGHDVHCKYLANNIICFTYRRSGRALKFGYILIMIRFLELASARSVKM